MVVHHNDMWYDAVLNQCNIANNNNKYYRLQVLKGSRGFACWQKWGRVGEPARGSASKFDGPFGSLDCAIRSFTKKYRDKTANAFGVSHFTPKSGKYVPIEIDNDVEVDTTELKIDTKPPPKIEYLPSKLDSATQELVQVLFSNEMRNEALVSFNLDLQKLPLGVPSQSQIQLGVEILDQIQSKLDGNAVTTSYEQLSSQFYTAIPHSFGRSRPPTISRSMGTTKCVIFSETCTKRTRRCVSSKRGNRKRQSRRPLLPWTCITTRYTLSSTW